MNLYEAFLEMREIPKGLWIDNPHDLIQTDFTISNNTLSILQTKESSVYFTRLSLKHLAEKEDAGEYILHNIQNILYSPDSIYLGNFSNRFLMSKTFIFQNNPKAHVISLEITQNTGNIIVTGFN